LKKRAFFALLILLCSLAGIGQTLTANFSADITSGCSPIVVNFQDKSTGPIVEWKWDFGNGATSTRQNPSSTYLTPGTYTVTLTVTDAAGNTSTSNKTNFITAYDEPAADFVADKRSGCFPMVVQFGDNSATPSGTTINSWLWDFGNGASSNQQNPKYVYRDPGSYTVTLTITNNAGCKKLITKPNYIDVSAGVVPGFDYTDPAVCSAPATVSFTNNSAGPGTLSYNWTFGDGQTSTSANASNYYAVNGNYHVTLFVSSSMGCADSASKDIRVGKVNTDFIVPASICPKDSRSLSEQLHAAAPAGILVDFQRTYGYASQYIDDFSDQRHLYRHPHQHLQYLHGHAGKNDHRPARPHPCLHGFGHGKMPTFADGQFRQCVQWHELLVGLWRQHYRHRHKSVAYVHRLWRVQRHPHRNRSQRLRRYADEARADQDPQACHFFSDDAGQGLHSVPVHVPCFGLLTRQRGEL
jgi:PKD repeat protein